MKNFYLAITFTLFSLFTFSQNQPFITTWEVTASDLDITIPTHTGSTYNYTVDFGDGTILTNQTGNATHTYSSPGTYTVKIVNDFPRIHFKNSTDNDKIKSIENWGDIQWQSMKESFYECSNLVINATDAPDLTQVADLSYMFYGCSSFNQSINHWDVSNVTNMAAIFADAVTFNQPLNNWDVSNVTNMFAMFSSTISFNQPIDSWNVFSVTDMSGMFNTANSFNQPLNNWDVSNVTNMGSMFHHAESFNQPLNNWDVSNVIHMGRYSSFPAGAEGGMFAFTTAFNQLLNNWDVSNVTDMSSMFISAESFNQPLNNWDVSNVNDMSGMFTLSTNFNQPLDNWDVSNVIDIEDIFLIASNFNQDLSNWTFNMNINHFYHAFSDSGLSVENYDKLLASLAGQNINNKHLGATGLEYCDVTSRNYLINTLGWTISDNGQFSNCGVNTENPIANQIIIYPNPTQSVLNIETQNNQPIEEIKIYNLNGLELQTLKGNQQLNLERLSSGIYFIEITTAEGVVTKRVLKD